jgi:hypothetical protein
LGEAPGVGAVGVVVAKVLAEVLGEGGRLGDQGAGERGAPVRAVTAVWKSRARNSDPLSGDETAVRPWETRSGRPI